MSIIILKKILDENLELFTRLKIIDIGDNIKKISSMLPALCVHRVIDFLISIEIIE